MLDQRRRRWANIKPTLVQRHVFAAPGVFQGCINPCAAGTEYTRVQASFKSN